MTNEQHMPHGLLPRQVGILRQILAPYAQAITRVDLFGSRSGGRYRNNSDIDLVIHGDLLEKDIDRLHTLFQESALPFSVDVKSYALTQYAPLKRHMDMTQCTLFTKDDLVLHDAENESLQEHVRRYGKVISENIDLVSFTSLLSHIVDNRGKTCPTSKFGIPLIATNCITNDTLYPVYDTERYVDQKIFKDWFRAHPEPNDIIFVCKGSPGRVNIAPDPVDFCIAQDMVAVRADSSKVYWKYLFAVLRSDYVQRQIQNMHVGTMIPHFKKGDFGSLQIPLPDSTAQRIIGNIYFNLSLRIHLLRETNATLEAMAQALFKSWFVNFDPVHAKAEGRTPEGMDAETAALFPAEFEESELGMIPRGWKVCTLKEASAYLSRGIAPKYIESGGVVVLNQKCIRNFAVDFSKARRHDNLQRKTSGRELLTGDILVNSTGVGTLGRVAQLLYLYETTVADSHVTVVRASDQFSQNYLGLLLMGRQAEIEAMGEGTTGQTELGRQQLSLLTLVAPPTRIMMAFDMHVNTFRQRLTLNTQQIEPLTALRDTLLPRLISGKLRLPEFAGAENGASA